MISFRFRWNILVQRVRYHADFLLLFTLFFVFRTSAILFFRPGGYIRDYSDLLYYHARASWQDFGLLPYRDYWSEYPPLFTWFTLWVDRLSREIPLWEDDRLWFAAIFGLCTTLAEVATFISIYLLGNRLYPNGGLRVAWLYASLFLPIYLLGGWYDALAVATIFVALALLLYLRKWIGLLLFGVVVAIGGLLKLVPLAILAVLPLALSSWPKRLVAAFVALTLFFAGYLYAYLQGPAMTVASVRSLVDRSGWSTIYALVNNYRKLGTVQGDVFSLTPDISLYEPRIPQWPFLAAWLLIGLAMLLIVWRQQPTPQSDRRIVAFAALTYVILLLAYPAWNPQYALYILPFLPLLWPNARGVLYALALTALVLLEHPIYFNMIGPDYPSSYQLLFDIDYQQLLIPIILSRTALLVMIALDIALMLLRPTSRGRIIPVSATIAILAILLTFVPRFAHAYTVGRLASSPLRPLALYLNTQEASLPIVTQQQSIGRELRPFLNDKSRLLFAGGRPDRLDPLPALVDIPFIYLQAAGDGATILDHLASEHHCQPSIMIDLWQLLTCNGATPLPIAHFANGIQLLGVYISDESSNQVKLTLLWMTNEPLSTDYKAFVHIADANENIVGQWDQVPGSGASGNTSATQQWKPKTVIVDDYRIAFDSISANGPQRIWVGLYDSQTGERLAIVESKRSISENRLEVATLPLP